MRKFYLQYHCRNPALIEERLTQIRTARPLTEDSAIVDALSFAVQVESAQFRPIIDGIARFDQSIAQQFAAHPDHELFESLPGAGSVLPRAG